MKGIRIYLKGSKWYKVASFREGEAYIPSFPEKLMSPFIGRGDENKITVEIFYRNHHGRLVKVCHRFLPGIEGNYGIINKYPVIFKMKKFKDWTGGPSDFLSVVSTDEELNKWDELDFAYVPSEFTSEYLEFWGSKVIDISQMTIGSFGRSYNPDIIN
jgi:hypothetical protein